MRRNTVSRSASPTSRPRSRHRSTPGWADRHAAADGAGGAQFPARRQVERRRRHDQLPRAHRTSSATSSTRAPCPSARPASPTTTRAIPATPRSSPTKQSRTPMVYVGGNDGMLHAFDDSTTGRRRQGNLGVRSQGAVHRRRPERHRAHAVARIPARSVELSVAAGSRSSRTSSTSTPRRASGTSISPTPTRRTPPQIRQRLAHDAGGRARRGRPRGLCARRHDAGRAHRHGSRRSVVEARALGVHRRPILATSSIAPTLVKT